MHQRRARPLGLQSARDKSRGRVTGSVACDLDSSVSSFLTQRAGPLVPVTPGNRSMAKTTFAECSSKLFLCNNNPTKYSYARAKHFLSSISFYPCNDTTGYSRADTSRHHPAFLDTGADVEQSYHWSGAELSSEA